MIHKYLVETGGMLCSVPFRGRRDETTDMHAKKWIQMAQKLSETLWKGHVRYGNIRVPLNGDTTRLAQAEGLSKKEKAMAREICRTRCILV